MGSRDFGYIGMKLASIYFFIKFLTGALNQILSWVSNALKDISSNYPDGIFIIGRSDIGVWIIYLLISLILWNKTDALLKYILPNKASEQENHIEINKESLKNLQLIAFSVVGLAFLAKSINIIYFNIIQWFGYLGFRGADNFIYIPIIASLIGGVVWLTIGLLLLFKPEILAKLIKTLDKE